jgi:hypothetical protein
MVAIEEALLVRELVQGLGLSQHAVARRSGHDVRKALSGAPRAARELRQWFDHYRRLAASPANASDCRICVRCLRT